MAIVGVLPRYTTVHVFSVRQLTTVIAAPPVTLSRQPGSPRRQLGKFALTAAGGFQGATSDDSSRGLGGREMDRPGERVTESEDAPSAKAHSVVSGHFVIYKLPCY